ncbi:MAG: hypothetical protein GKR89_11485 [Candidatus Latescibacteria bacterium]|nr:hypothetical protein [Candidatus Latescibacterota bacterium]
MATAQDSTLVAFKLKDQFNREYSDKTWAHQLLVVIGSDRDGSQYNEPWGRALRDSLSTRAQGAKVHLVGLSDLRGVPFFLKGLIKSKFPQERDHWVLMDWGGLFPKTYRFVEKHCNILVFAPSGRLVWQTAVTQVQPTQMQSLLAALDKQLDQLPSD